MISAKSKLSKQQKKDFKELIDTGNKLINSRELNNVVIVGQIRLPDSKNGLKEPEIQFGLITKERAQQVEFACYLAFKEEPKPEQL